MGWQFSSRKTLNLVTRNSKDILLRILWNTILSNLIKIELGKRVSLYSTAFETRRFCVTYTKIGFTVFWIRTQLEFSVFFPNRNQPHIVNQYFFREVFGERNSRLKLGWAECKMYHVAAPNQWYSYPGKSFFGLPFLTVTSFHPLFTLNVNSEHLQRNAA